MNSLIAIKQLFEEGCLAFCMWALLLIAAFALMCATGALRDIVNRWTRLGKLDRLFVICGIVFVTLTGATKGWNPVPNGGADTISGTSLVGIYRGISNDVQTVGGVVTTNEIHQIHVRWTGSGITSSTPVQYRYADTNYWTRATKTNLEYGTFGTTNYMTFVVTSNVYNMANWWVGVNTPSVVITTSGIDITGFTATGNGVTISWTTEDRRATKFRVWRKLPTDNDWTSCGDEVEGNSTTVNGFFLDKLWQWRVSSDFLEDGE